MTNLPIYVDPYKDEMMISWMHRLAAALGFCSYLDFYNYFVNPGQDEHLHYKGSSRMDGQIRLDILQEGWGVPMVDLYLQHTEYAAVAPFLPPYRQASILLNAYNNPLGTKYARCSSNARAEKQGIKYCPLCQKDAAYARVWQNIPGINACCIHGCRLHLVQYNRSTQSILCSDDTILPADEMDIRIAALAKRMYEQPIQCHYGTLNQLTFDLFKPNIKEGAFNCMAAAVIERGITDQVLQMKEPYILPDLGPEYEILSHSYIYCVVRHSCGMTFPMNVWGLKHGLLCPHCQQADSVSERFQRIISAEGDFALMSDMKTVNDTVTIRYPDGIVREHRANIFLNNLFPKPKARCGYPGRQPEDVLRERKKRSLRNALNQYDGFVCEDLVDNPYKGGCTVTIRHISCGKTFSCSPRSFQIHPQCPYCCEEAQSTAHENAVCETYISQNTPDFTYLGGYHGSHSAVSLRHICGYEFKERFSIFKNKPECPYCRRAEATGSGAFLKRIKETYGNVFPRYGLANDLQMSKAEVKSRIGSLSAAGLVRRLDDRMYEITPPDQINDACILRHTMPLYVRILNWAVREKKCDIFVSEVVAVFGIHETTACFYLRRLESCGFVTKICKAQYKLADSNQKELSAGEWSLYAYPDATYTQVYRYIHQNMGDTFTRQDLQNSWDNCPLDLDHLQKALIALVRKNLLCKKSYHLYAVVNT